MDIQWQNELFDPETKKPLSLKIEKKEGNEVLEGIFISPDKKEYPIIKGIPRFLLEELFTQKKGKVDSEAVENARYFGNKWRVNAIKSLGHTQAEKELLQETFLALLGCHTLEDLERIFSKAETCLDVGCGVGWIEDLFNINKETKWFAVDISQSVEEAYERVKKVPNILVTQADVFNMPFREDYFDIVFSNGVIHHTANPEKAFNTLCRYLKPGGLIGIYIYKKKPLLREIADNEIRKSTTNMSFDECLNFSQQLTALGKALQEIKQPIIIEKDIPLLNISKGDYNLQRFFYDHILKCFYNRELGEDFSHLINLDWYSAKYHSHHTQEEIQSWFDENYIGEVKVIQPPGWEHSGYFFSGRKKK